MWLQILQLVELRAPVKVWELEYKYESCNINDMTTVLSQ